MKLLLLLISSYCGFVWCTVGERCSENLPCSNRKEELCVHSSCKERCRKKAPGCDAAEMVCGKAFKKPEKRGRICCKKRASYSDPDDGELYCGKKRNGAKCSSGDMCRSGTCFDGVCIPPPTYSKIGDGYCGTKKKKKLRQSGGCFSPAGLVTAKSCEKWAKSVFAYAYTFSQVKTEVNGETITGTGCILHDPTFEVATVDFPYGKNCPPNSIYSQNAAAKSVYETSGKPDRGVECPTLWDKYVVETGLGEEAGCDFVVEAYKGSACYLRD